MRGRGFIGASTAVLSAAFEQAGNAAQATYAHRNIAANLRVGPLTSVHNRFTGTLRVARAHAQSRMLPRGGVRQRLLLPGCLADQVDRRRRQGHRARSSDERVQRQIFAGIERTVGVVKEGALADPGRDFMVIMKDGKVYRNSLQ